MSSELACTYAALILNDDGIDITADKLTAILKVRFAFCGFCDSDQFVNLCFRLDVKF